MVFTPLPKAPHTSPRNLGEMRKNKPPRPNMDIARSMVTIPLSTSAWRTVAPNVLNWYREQGLTPCRVGFQPAMTPFVGPFFLARSSVVSSRRHRLPVQRHTVQIRRHPHPPSNH